MSKGVCVCGHLDTDHGDPETWDGKGKCRAYGCPCLEFLNEPPLPDEDAEGNLIQ